MENEKRLIDANELEAHFRETKMIEIFPYWKELSFDTQSELVRFGKEIKKMIQNAPTVDAVEVVHGHWTATNVIVHKAGYGVRYYYHAECRVNPHRLFECENDYCPNCGAKMDS